MGTKNPVDIHKKEMSKRELSSLLHELAGEDYSKDGCYIYDGGEIKVDGSYLSFDLAAGASFCFRCADYLAVMFEAHGVRDEDGGVAFCPDDGESDIPRNCEWCYAPLSYCLTDEGARDAMAHYVENPPTWPISKDDCLSFGRRCRKRDSR